MKTSAERVLCCIKVETFSIIGARCQPDFLFIYLFFNLNGNYLLHRPPKVFISSVNVFSNISIMSVP